MTEHFLFTEKYRPSSVEQCLLPPDIKQQFQQFVDSGQIPNLILEGPPGTGKTSVAIAMIKQLNAEYIMINGSMNGNIDTLRNDIQQFASSISLAGGRKYVIIDEADYLNPQSTQPALRGFIEEFAGSCGFIMTCNYINKIIEPLRSRCTVITFKYKGDSTARVAIQFVERLEQIAQAEGITAAKTDITSLVRRFMPDWRRIINEFQRLSVSGTLTAVDTASELEYRTLLTSMKNKDFVAVRKWVSEYGTSDPTAVFRRLYDLTPKIYPSNQIPAAIVLLGEYQFKHAFVADPEINLCACLVDMMHSIEMKG